MKMRITKHGEDVLKAKAKPADYDEIKEDLPNLLRDMWDTMRAVKGVGLAAPQINLSVRLAIIDIKREGEPDEMVLINPKILAREGPPSI